MIRLQSEVGVGQERAVSTHLLVKAPSNFLESKGFCRYSILLLMYDGEDQAWRKYRAKTIEDKRCTKSLYSYSFSWKRDLLLC